MASELTIKADYRLLDEARALIHWTGRQTGFDEAAIHDVKVAATEALANAIEHGTARDGLIHLRLTPREGELQLEISGGGKSEQTSAAAGERRPSAPNPRRGRGTAIMFALMDEVAFKRDGNDTLIQLVKRKAPASAGVTA